MWSCILRAFAPVDPKQISDLIQSREYRFSAADLGASKQRLSGLIAHQILPVQMFYRLEGSCSGSKLIIAFYLFEDRRICPLRIFNRTELFGRPSAGSDWMVDFNGLPLWSAITAVEPRWKLLGSLPPNNSTVRLSGRDWKKRNCWVIDLADQASAFQDLAS